MEPLLDKNRFPHLYVISASAGTGKTFALSKRIAAYLLSNIKNNDLRNILAITFTINAAKEMKKRVLNWLKGLALSDGFIYSMLGISEKEREFYSVKAIHLIDNILTSYKDFQIKTIDSFLASLFKASAIEFGYSQNFEIVLNSREFMEKAFEIYISNVSDKNNHLIKVIDFMNENEKSFNFTPYKKIFKTINSLYVKEKHFLNGFINDDKDLQWQKVVDDIKDLIKEIEKLKDEFQIEFSKASSIQKMIDDVKKGDIHSFFSRGDSNKPYLAKDKDKPGIDKLENLWEELKTKRAEAVYLFSERYFYPYLKVLEDFKSIVEKVKKDEEVIFIEDVPSVLAKYINNEYIPDIYLKLGCRIYHFFIDEFQDTSPVQWYNLSLLIENALSMGGSLFVVGDTKQAIYGFRDTDYRIMKNLSEKRHFYSVAEENFVVETLEENFRSGENIIQYVKEVFETAQKEYLNYGGSGLFSWTVKINNSLKGQGYVSAKVIASEDDGDELKEKEELFKIIQDLRSRGYDYRDITILAHKNSQIVEISSWLNEKNYPFLSYSSLDIRERKVIQEIISLLKFLDSPIDNLSFSFFILGKIFSKVKDDRKALENFVFRNKNSKYLYKSFQDAFRSDWEAYFDKLFKYVGYLPLYELVCLIINSFNITENFSDEAGAVARFLEIVKDLEAKGKNSLKEFVEFLALNEQDEYESGKVFELSIPENSDAIKVMTVHKSKGLSGKAVIYLIYELSAPSDNMKICEVEDGLKIMKINKDTKNEELARIYSQVEKTGRINDLNSFYVGLTRAERELYVIGVGKRNKDGKIKKGFPLDLVLEKEVGEKSVLQVKTSELEKRDELQITVSEEIKLNSSYPEKLAYEEKRRGEFIHLILSEIENSGDSIQEVVYNLARKYHFRYREFNLNKLVDEIVSFISHPVINPFFTMDCKQLFLEKTFVDREGLLRVDRIMMKDDEAIVVDYKTGEKEEQYKKQLERYAKVVREIFDRRVVCYVLYFDKKEVEKVYES